MENNQIVELLRGKNLLEISVGCDGWVEGYKANRSETYMYTNSIKEFKTNQNSILIISENGVINNNNLTYAYNEYIEPMLLKAIAKKVFG